MSGAAKLRAHISRVVAVAEHTWSDADAWPVQSEIRIGTIDSDQQQQFGVQVAPETFYATFQELSQRADGVTPVARETWSAYPPPTPAMVREVTHNDDDENDGKTAWLNVASVVPPVHAPWSTSGGAFWQSSGWHFDVCVCAEHPQRISMPNTVREARRLAKRVKRPLESVRTRAGMPEVMQHRQQRSLRFAANPAWLVQFTAAHLSTVVFGNSGIGNEHMMQAGPEVCDVTLRYTPLSAEERPEEGELCEANAVVLPTWTPQEAASQAILLLSMLATALGTSTGAMERRLAADRHAHEMAMCEFMMM